MWRGLLAAPLLSALSLARSEEVARAGTVNPSETEATLPGTWRVNSGADFDRDNTVPVLVGGRKAHRAEPAQ
jgi:hypothetical protein